MTESRSPSQRPSASETAEDARRTEETLRQRWEETQESILERFDQPISKATDLTRRTLAWFPVRVWRHFSLSNGFLLAAGVSYQALFAVFAAIYLAFAIAGIWLGGGDAVYELIDIINSYIPGLISDSGAITPAQVQEIVAENSTALGVTGLIALGILIWTAMGWVTFVRRAVREIFDLPFDLRPYLLLKARDLLAAAVFGLALLLSAALSSVVGGVFAIFGISGRPGTVLAVQFTSIAVSFVVNSLALASLFRFLTGASLRWRTIWPGSLLGGAALTVVQLGAGLLLGYTPSNPLLATFAIFIALLVWFRVDGIIMLVAASWISVHALDQRIPLLQKSEAQRVYEEHQALLLAARVRLRTAQDALAVSPWHRRAAATRAVRRAEGELEMVEKSAPPAPTHGLWPPETVRDQR